MYQIEVTRSKNPKSPYRLRWRFNTESQAALWWAGLNIGLGYKARIRFNGKTIARKGD